jgi:hypothetical protein
MHDTKDIGLNAAKKIRVLLKMGAVSKKEEIDFLQALDKFLRFYPSIHPNLIKFVDELFEEHREGLTKFIQEL